MKETLKQEIQTQLKKVGQAIKTFGHEMSVMSATLKEQTDIRSQIVKRMWRMNGAKAEREKLFTDMGKVSYRLVKNESTEENQIEQIVSRLDTLEQFIKNEENVIEKLKEKACSSSGTA